MPYTSPLASIVTSSIGRGAELKYGPGNNQYARASDVNPIIDYIGVRDTVNIYATQTGNSVTINYPIGRLTTASLTTAAATTSAISTTTITVTNSTVTANSIVCASLEAYSGTINTNGFPMIYKITPAAGSFTIQIANFNQTNALAGTVTLSFRVS